MQGSGGEIAVVNGVVWATYHTSPLSVLEFLFGGAPDTLRAMQAEQAVVVLPDDVLRSEEVVEEPLFTERAYVRAEYGSSERSEVPWLVHSEEKVLYLKRL